MINSIRNLLGSLVVVTGAFIFQMGYFLMTEDMKNRFAQKFIEKLSDALNKA